MSSSAVEKATGLPLFGLPTAVSKSLKPPKTPTLPTVEKVEPVATVTDDAERQRQRVRRTATGRQSTLRAGIANALKKRLGA